MSLRTFAILAVLDIGLFAVSIVLMVGGLVGPKDGWIIGGMILAHMTFIFSLLLLHLSMKGPRAPVQFGR